MRRLKKSFYCLLFIAASCVTQAHAQAWVDSVVQIHTSKQIDSVALLNVAAINISGNKKTKEYIIRREIQFVQSDKIKATDLKEALIRARQQIYNTTLFTDVRIVADVVNDTSVIVAVSVKERWYIYPLPQFQLVDRNFNEWIKLHNGDLNRVNYGLKFTHYNLTGRRDQLLVSLVNGYSRNISFSYTESYSNKNLTEGFGVNAQYAQNREIAIATAHDNKLLFFPADSAVKNNGNFVRNVFAAGGSYIIRKGFFKKQVISITYTNLKVNDSIVTSRYNPHYFNSSNPHQSFIDLSYTYQFTNVNNISYPLRGIIYFVTATKRGFGFKDNINLFQVEAGVDKFIPLGNKWFASFQLNGKIKLPFEQAYINQRGLGYAEVYLRGLEYYVVDGVVTGLARTTLKKKIGSFNMPFILKAIRTIPFTFYVKTFADAGYAYNKDPYRSYLNNRFLYTGGFGIDIVTLYDISFRIEYSFNQLNENGLFLHTKSGF